MHSVGGRDFNKAPDRNDRHVKSILVLIFSEQRKVYSFQNCQTIKPLEKHDPHDLLDR